ncbi:MAG: PAC2 family protein [Anaerolineae bacterium]|jgi:proteasome assembly chaperone (PAC2) family protein|nr:PAC2 family protein [Anaerolineae bacterium]
MDDELLTLWEIPKAKEIFMIAGWHQWADAGAISSGLPLYLVHKTNARKIGEIKDDGFYLFQIPGAHHFLRPEIHLEDGHRKSLKKPTNEFYYVGDDKKGLVIFVGEEPHMRVDRYAEVLLDAVQALGVKRVSAVGGVYGAIPYDQDREVSCVYSLPSMQDELSRYAVRFSNYEGGATIGTYLVDAAEQRGIEFFVFYAFVPAYSFSDVSEVVQGLSIEHDFKAWYDVMRRLNHMAELGIDLSELEEQSYDLMVSMDAKIEELDEQMPDLDVRAYLEEVSDDFSAKPFVPPLSDVWGKAIGNLLDDD